MDSETNSQDAAGQESPGHVSHLRPDGTTFPPVTPDPPPPPGYETPEVAKGPDPVEGDADNEASPLEQDNADAGAGSPVEDDAGSPHLGAAAHRQEPPD